MDRPLALIGETRATEMLANVFFPLAIAHRPERWAEYGKLRATTSNRKVETVIARLFGDRADGVAWSKTAAHQQGLLQIYEDFCLQDNSNCEHCTFPERVKRFEFGRV